MESFKSEVNILRKMILDPFPRMQKTLKNIRKSKGKGLRFASKSTDSSNLPLVKVYKVQHTMFPCFAQEPIKHKTLTQKKSFNQVIAPLNVTGKHFDLTSTSSVQIHKKLEKNLRPNFFISKVNKKIFDLASNIKLKIPQILKHDPEKKIKKGKSFEDLKKNNLRIIETTSKPFKNFSRKNRRSITIKGWEP